MNSPDERFVTDPVPAEDDGSPSLYDQAIAEARRLLSQTPPVEQAYQDSGSP